MKMKQYFGLFVHHFVIITIVPFAKIVLHVANDDVDVNNIVVVVLGLSFVSINVTLCITYHSG